jgi:serine/threonine protein kinase
MTDLVGQSLGQYQILSEIATGGMSTVYLARQTSMNRDVAIKVLPRTFLHDNTFLERFNREVDIIAHLQHPHILPVYDYGQFSEMPYIVMAYLRGGTLTDKIKREGAMDTAEVARITREIADALDYAHSKGIIHRDFKPGNVLLDEQGNTYLADFGLAKLRESSSQITRTSAMLGTPAYMPPEQADSSELTAAADVYALGVTVFQMLTGRVPFEGSTTQILIAHAMQPIPNIRDFRPSLSPETQNIINRAMAKNPAERYGSAGKLAQGLRAALEGQGVVAVSEAPQSALLMTNMLGQVIFVDHHCLSMLKIPQSEARTIIGKGLDDVLGVTPQVAQELIKDVSTQGQIDGRKVGAKDSEGEPFEILCSAIATYDNKKNFVGSDFTLKPIWTGIEETKIIETPSQVEKLDSTEESYLQVYFTTQYDALQKLLTQVGGKRLSEHLDKIINETAERNVWPVKAQGGQLTINLKSSDADSYRALLAKSVTYANMVIGDRIVAREMNAVDAKMNPKILEYVQTFRLR